MKNSQFRRWLLARGVVMKEGSRHTKLYYGRRQAVLPRHAKELKEGTMKSILRQLGIDEPSH